MSEDTHPVRYGAGRTCEACDQKFGVFDDFRKVVIESDDDSFPAPAYFEGQLHTSDSGHSFVRHSQLRD